MPVESFEGLSDANNSPTYSNGMPSPGYNGVYTFNSGVSLVKPIPNDSLATR